MSLRKNFGNLSRNTNQSSSSNLRDSGSLSCKRIFTNDAFYFGINQLIKLTDKNSDLNNKLKATHKELSTLKRQCKIQDVRLSQASRVDSESLIERLSTDIKNLTLINREKSHKCQSLERSLTDSKNQLECANRSLVRLQNEITDLHQNSSPSPKRFEDLVREKQNLLSDKTDLERRLKILQKTFRQREGNWDEKVRLLEDQLKEKDFRIEKLNKANNDNRKLLGLLNIYSRRFPINIEAEVPFYMSSEGSSQSRITENAKTSSKVSVGHESLKTNEYYQHEKLKTESHSQEEIISDFKHAQLENSSMKMENLEMVVPTLITNMNYSTKCVIDQMQDCTDHGDGQRADRNPSSPVDLTERLITNKHKPGKAALFSLIMEKATPQSRQSSSALYRSEKN